MKDENKKDKKEMIKEINQALKEDQDRAFRRFLIINKKRDDKKLMFLRMDKHPPLYYLLIGLIGFPENNLTFRTSKKSNSCLGLIFIIEISSNIILNFNGIYVFFTTWTFYWDCLRSSN